MRQRMHRSCRTIGSRPGFASILGLSEFTVNRHVSNAANKLGCANKHHAACRALVAGLIQPAPARSHVLGAR